MKEIRDRARRWVAVLTVFGLLSWTGFGTPIAVAKPVTEAPWIIDEGDRLAVRLGGPEGIDGRDVRVVFSKHWVPSSGRLPKVAYRVTLDDGTSGEFVLSDRFADSVAEFMNAARFDPDAQIGDFLDVDDAGSLRALEKELSLESFVAGVALDRSHLDSRALAVRAETFALLGAEGAGDLRMAGDDALEGSAANQCLAAITAAAAGGIGMIGCCAGTLGLACVACAFLEGMIVGLTAGICNDTEPGDWPDTPGCGITCFHCLPSPSCECVAPIPMFPDDPLDDDDEECHYCPEQPGLCILL